MAVTLRRGPREQAPEVPSGRIVLQSPPEITPSEGASSLLMNAVPMLGSVGSIAFVALSQPGIKGYIAGGMFLVASLGFVGVNGWKQRQQHAAGVSEARREYLAYLGEVRETVREAANRQRAAALWNNPAPEALPAVCEERTRVWERSTGDDDFLRVRFGRTNQPLCITLEAPDTPPMAQLDPVAASALHRLLSTHRVQPDLPASVSLPYFSRIEVTGDAEPARALARSLIAAATTQHAPDQLQVAVVAGADALPEWEWVKWLPHAHSQRERDGVGPARMVASSLSDLEPMLPAELRERPRFGFSETATLPHVLVVVDGGDVPPGNAIVTEDGVLGVTVLHLPERWDELSVDSRMRLALGQPATSGPYAGRVPMQILTLGSEPARGFADQMSLVQAEAAARRLAPLYAGAEPERRDAMTGTTELVDLLGLGDVRDYDPEAAWRPRLQRDRLRVPIGVGAQGQVVSLDIKESAQQGMGPHGLVIGATGSGKSEVLRTLVLALAMTHSSEALNFVLVDFKG
ncbi:MAG TPA: FtsK/SpoIIIE domain-containing protein, partial [Pedococcus sp.]|nr:FtsK/SpoIIIE domain-containing protein [Pedococcus sp.]